jgi:signal transduction histidine kinase
MNSNVSALSARRETAGIRRRRTWWIVLLPIAVVVTVTQALNSRSQVVVELATMALGALTAAAFVVTSLFSVDSRERTSWICLAAGQICLAAGQGYAVLAPIDKHSFFDFGDALYIGFFTTAALGLLMQPMRSLTRMQQRRFRLDIAMTAISSSLVYGILVLTSTSPAASTEMSAQLLRPLLDLILVWVVVVVLLRQSSPSLWQLAYGCGVLLLASAHVMFLATRFGLLTDLRYGVVVTLSYSMSTVAMLSAALLHYYRALFRIKWSRIQRVAVSRFAPLLTEYILPYGWTIAAIGLILLLYGHWNIPMQDSDLLFVGVGSSLILLVSIARRWLTMEENADLVQRQVRVLGAARALAQPLDLRTVPKCILEQAANLIPNDEAHLALLREGDEAMVTSACSDGRFRRSDAATLLRLDAAALATLNGVTVLSPKVRTDAPEHSAVAMRILTMIRRAVWGDVEPSPRKVWIVAPLTADHKTIGVLLIGLISRRWKASDHPMMLDAFLQQAAAAVVNARLRQQQSDMAAMAERSRLSRELHDSVLQAIFGCSLGLRTAQHHVESANTSAHDALAYSLRLVEGAISEMRALIFELRPETLANEGLLIALQKQAQSLCDRHSVLASVHSGNGEPALADAEKETFYRIAIEALQNVIKHARARRVDIELHETTQRVCMVINDDGVGFDTAGDFRGHLGLVRMHERAAQAGAALVLTSAPGSGTRIELCKSGAATPP